ncbi:MAG: NUDIX hydrolase N-terminal domain-containing protein [Caldilineaceae bacterium]
MSPFHLVTLSPCHPITLQTEPNHAPFNDVTAEIVQIANELRSLGTVGRHYAENPYQVERNEKVMRLAARLLSLVETRDLAELERLFLTIWSPSRRWPWWIRRCSTPRIGCC